MKRKKEKRNTSFQTKKSLGQNFLTNQGILKIIVDGANILPNDTVLEVGPGKGSLTRALLERGAKVIAVEKDNRLIPILSEMFKNELNNLNFVLINDDILKLDLEKIVGGKNYKVVANIPYYITGSLIRLLLSGKTQPKLITLMLQKEVAKRIVALDKKESLLSLSIKAYGIPKYIKTVSRGSFSPAPKVDSAILSIEDISKDFFVDFTPDLFFEIIHAGFSSKRKKLISNLEKHFSKLTLTSIFKQELLSQNVRAEELSLNNWRNLAKKLNNPQ